MNDGGKFVEVDMGELFTVKGNPQLNKDSFVFSDQGSYPYFTRSILNNGILGYVNYLDEEHKVKGNCLAVGMMGMQFFYMEKDFYAGQFTKSIYPKKKKLPIFNSHIALYFTTLLNKFQPIYQGGLVRDFKKLFKKTTLILPFNNHKVDVKYIDSYISQLKIETLNRLKEYLKLQDLYDYQLTEVEKQALIRFEAMEDQGAIHWKRFKIKDLFNKIEQGSRLTKSDQTFGSLPFIMSGTTNTGVVSYIGNDIKEYPDNSLTIDIFGNVFYRNYIYGISDDVGAYWNTKESKNKPTRKNEMLFVGAALQRSLSGMFSYGSKLRSSKSHDLECQLPVKLDGTPDYDYMNTLISAVHKKVIKGVVEYVEQGLKQLTPIEK